MPWFFGKRRKRMRAGTTERSAELEEAIAARRAAEVALIHEHETVTVPLSEMHKVNHVTPFIRGIIAQRSAQRDT
jgi:hypothetical protein